MSSIIKRLYGKNPLQFVTYTVVGIAILIIVIILAIIVNYFGGLHGYSNNTEYYEGMRPTIVVTGSMEPVIAVNSLIYVKYTEIKDLEPGDIIRYNGPFGYSIVHRVIAIDQNGEFVITKGDANESRDATPVTNKEITGKVVQIHNEYAPIFTKILGKIDIEHFGNSLIRAFMGLVILSIIIGTTIFIIYYLFDLWIIHKFWTDKQIEMQDSLNWLDEHTTRDELNKIVDNYRIKYNNTYGIRRLILKERFRKFYDVMCTEERKAQRTTKYKKKLLKVLEGIEDGQFKI